MNKTVLLTHNKMKTAKRKDLIRRFGTKWLKSQTFCLHLEKMSLKKVKLFSRFKALFMKKVKLFTPFTEMFMKKVKLFTKKVA